MCGCHLHDAVQEDGPGHVVVVGEVGVEEDPVVRVTDVSRVVPHHDSVARPVVSHLLEARPHLQVWHWEGSLGMLKVKH